MKAELRIEFVEEIRKAITFAGQIGDYVINQSLFDWLESKLSAQSREIEEAKSTKNQNERMRLWFEERTGLKDELLSAHMENIDQQITDLKAEIEELKADLKIATSDDEELLKAINKLREQGF